MYGLRDSLTRECVVGVVLVLLAGFGLAVPVEAKTAPDADFGDAPEGVLAYPSSGVFGQFPTCVGTGPASWIEHNSQRLFLGPKVDVEANGNAGQCPTFNPEAYDRDEGIKDGDAGLIKPRAYSIRGSAGNEYVYSLVHNIGLLYLGPADWTSTWGINVDFEVHNQNTDGRTAYLNILMDWNQDGKWQGSVPGSDGLIAEHTLVNFPIPSGFNGLLSELNPPRIQTGPNAGYVWSRFTISERPVPNNWNGEGIFSDGETEDYLLRLSEPLFFCEWTPEDPNKMHWAQTADLRSTGLTVNLFGSSLAEDFRCSETGPITGIHFWASFMNDVRPSQGRTSLKFQVSFHANRPPDNEADWNRPGELLWTKEILPGTYDVDQVGSSFYKHGWYDPATKSYIPSNTENSYQYNICLREDEKELFRQHRNTVYWIVIKHIPEKDPDYIFGWKTTESRLRYNSRAAWLHPTLGWLPMSYPSGHPYQGTPLGLSLVIAGPTVPQVEMDFGDAPDPKYPTRLASDGARHTIVPGIYLGAGVDADADGQPDATATGDDDDKSDDEDGVAFVSPLTPGDAAAVEVTASLPGALNAWVDFNADGDWDDAGEQIFKDESLTFGVNTLAFVVPGSAATGETISRWRFSTVRGLKPSGEASDGEVEDHLVRIEDGGVPGQPPTDHVKWSQPPIERAPGSNAAVYCGWDEPSYTSKPLQSTVSSWAMVADDFRCPADVPVTSIHWWGSYRNWDSDRAPSIRPQSWRIAFWSNIPADSRYPFSRPGNLLHVVTAPASRVTEQRVGSDAFPGQPSDTCFDYVLPLDADEFFYGDDYAFGSADGAIFWISITAVYSGSPGPSYVWGWKTRPEPWMDAAVRFDLRRDDLRAGITPDPAGVQPITNSLVCERLDRFDMAFELDTTPDYVKWQQPFTGLRQWPHYEDEESLALPGSTNAEKWRQDPDLNRTGIDVDITSDIPPTWPAQVCADDFQCTTTGPITGITLWASWYRDIVSRGNPENVLFTLSIREDIPANRSSTGFSMPGKVLWRKEFRSGEFTVEGEEGTTQGYYSPANAAFDSQNHQMVYKYLFDIEPKDAFVQTGTAKDPTVYWLCAQAYLLHTPGSVATRFGWKSSPSHWNDAAVWASGSESSQPAWQKLTYPKGHSLSSQPVDLAFAIETEGAGGGDVTFRRLVADDWECRDATPVTGVVWWGSYIGYGYQACECQQAEAPRAPDYFLLSIWSDDSSSLSFSHPGQKLWEYQADDFDEVLVGFDKHPEPQDSSINPGAPGEPVYRYTVRLPEKDWFRQTGARSVCWLSVVAVYENAGTMNYPWGWTNHPSEPWDVSNQGLVGHWKLDESDGTIASDSSGRGNHGTLIGAPDWRPAGGQIGGALDLDGKNDYILVGKPKGLDFAPGSFSASAWVKADTTIGQWRAIMEYDRTSFNGNRFGLWIDPSGRFHFRVGRNTWQSARSLKANTWYLLTATYDGDTQRMRLYIDGIQDASATHTAGFVAPVEAKLTIGVRGSADDEFFNGLLDDVRIYDVKLSDDDVLRLVGVGANNDAVAGTPKTDGAEVWDWVELVDQTGTSADMSFVLFTDPLGGLTVDDGDGGGDGGGWTPIGTKATEGPSDDGDKK